MAECGQLSLQGLVKDFNEGRAVDRLDLEIEAGEFFSLLGASGCGKTTTLRMIAGFERPDAGTIRLDGADLGQVSPHRRPVNTVFQSYALFPFLNVWDNVAFGMRYHDVDRATTKRRIGSALELVRMESFAKRRPHQLSGGQQQRVALARALVLRPTVLLLDEPLGALDAKLRKQLQIELRTLQKSVETTFVYVTHDQEEALTMSDRLAVLVDGRVEQVGTPSEVYSRPASAYVAGFLGAANLFDAQLIGVVDGDVSVQIEELVLRACPDGARPASNDVCVVVRPERVEISPPEQLRPSGDANVVDGVVEHLVFHGATTHVGVRSAGCLLTAEVPNVHGTQPDWLHQGLHVCVRISTSAVQLLPTSVSAPAAAS
ncbi:MAG: ABC transporter ATP-binding protein [Nocardioidaceae bacterium]